MALADFLALGNSAKGAYDAQMQAIVNAQNQQRINDMLANDALKRHLMQQQVTGGGMGLLALGSTPTAQPPAPVASPVAPAPAPGQNSAQQPAPQQVPMPGGGNVAQFTPQGGFSNVTTPQQVQRGMALGTIPWQQGAAIIKDMQARGTLGQQFARGQQPGGAWMAPAPTTGPAQAPQGISSDTQGIVGKSLALAQNNLPVSLVAKFVQNFKHMYPNATPEQAYFAMQQASPVLTAQATDASRVAGMGIDSLFKGLTSWAQITNAQTRQQLLPSQIEAYQARAKYEGAMSNLFGAGGQGGGLQSPTFQANLALFQKYHPGMQPSRYMLGVMMNTDPSAFQANMLAGQSQGAGAKAVGGALGKATTTASMLEANYTAFDRQMQLVQQLQQKVPSLTNSPWMNQKILNYKTNLAGDPQAKAYVQAMLAAAGEYAKIIRGGGSQVTNHARDLADQALNKSITPAQLQALLPVLAKESQNIIGGWKDQVSQLSGQLQQPTINASAGGGSAPSAPSAPATAASAQPQAPQAAVDYLKAHPDLAPQFKAKYGYLPPGM